MNRPSQVIVLAEDERHVRFVQAYLKSRGIGAPIRVEDLPSGRGSGEQLVRDRYATAVAGFRRRRAATVLVVVIDADATDVRHRLRQLADALTAAGKPPRADGESIVHLIPKRNIETWILCLNGSHVDEVRDYKAQVEDQQIAFGAESLFNGSRRNIQPPAHWIPSLLSAIPEVRRLD